MQGEVWDFRSSWYEVKFENAFLRAKGTEFQALFERLMGIAFRGDFMACQPWGAVGDLKNDGYLPSKRTLFQCFAPRSMRQTVLIAKINADFAGAVQHWRPHFDTWVLAHNEDAGLPAKALEAVLQLRAANPDIHIETWSLEELRAVFRQLPAADMATLLGPAPDDTAKARVGFGELQSVLEHLAGHGQPDNAAVAEVPARKLQANALSPATVALLRAGVSKAQLVRAFFNSWHDATLGERVAVAFRAEYTALRNNHTPPNAIFAQLLAWTGGSQRGTQEHEVAVLAVLAYYFERCDIFEAPREVLP